jgi:Biotin carboxylase
VSSAASAHEFAERAGFPLILKPRSGAGASGTVRVDSVAELDDALGVFGGQGVESIAVEEFVEGHEGFYDTIAVDGRVAVDFVSHYYPNVLEAMRTRWISPQFVSTNRLDTAPEYGELREMGQRVITALGIGTSATHMEWFFGRRGCGSPRSAAGRPAWAPGTCTRRATIWTCTGSGRTPSCTAGLAPCRRGGTPAGSWPCGPRRTA